MKPLYLLSAFLLFLAREIHAQLQQTLPDDSTSSFFIENKGQWPEEVLYLYRTNNLKVWITRSGVVYDHYRFARRNEHAETSLPFREGQVVKITHKACNLQPTSVGIAPLAQGHYNYFLGNDPAKWIKEVKLYQQVEIKEIYPGISQRWYIDKGQLRYDYLFAPEAPLAALQLHIQGATSISLQGDTLILQTRFGKIMQGQLRAYQVIHQKLVPLAAQWRWIDSTSVGFQIEGYQPQYALVLDPLLWSTFIGGMDEDVTTSIALDKDKNLCIAGYTQSNNFPSTPGSYDATFDNATDIFVTKLDSAGKNLLWSTFIGGKDGDFAKSIAIDGKDDLYLVGRSSGVFPITAGSYDNSYNGGSFDIIVLKLSNKGNQLLWSTYVGSSGVDHGNGIAIDEMGNVYVVGNTSGNNFPTTQGSHDQSFNQGPNDVVVFKLNPEGKQLLWSTYLGGSSIEEGLAICLQADNVYVTGLTWSTNFPITSNVYDATYNGNTDIFLSCLNASRGVLVWSTFIGGNANEQGQAIAVDRAGYLYITGFSEYSYTTNFPTTSGAYDPSQNQKKDIIAAKFSPTGDRLIWSTFIGGAADEVGNAIALDALGNVYLTGYTSSANFPASAGNNPLYLPAYDKDYNGGQDVFLAKLSADGKMLWWSSFVGSSNNEESSFLLVDETLQIYLTGLTNSVGFPVTTNTYSQSYKAKSDAFAMKFCLDPLVVLTSAAGSDNQTANLNTEIKPINYRIANAVRAEVEGLPAGVRANATADSSGALTLTITGKPTTPGVFHYTIKPIGCKPVVKKGTITVK